MSVWFCIPSKAPASKVQDIVDLWRRMGYKVAIWRDPGDGEVNCDYLRYGPYPGYAKAVNALAAEVLDMDQQCDWIVTGGDDTEPDPRVHADLIARQCSRHFATSGVLEHGDAESVFGTYGVMQPTGDGHGIETICGSPWLGREWCRRAHGGTGPLWHEYTHMFVDSDLQAVAKRQGVLWQRPDLTQKHQHWSFHGIPMPSYLREANSPAHWTKFKALFEARQRAGFPGSEPLAA